MAEMKPLDPSALQQLMLLKKHTEWTSTLHDAQLYQLKMWSLLLFEHVKDFGIDFDWEKANVEITFLKFEKDITEPVNLEERCVHMNDWIQSLLGDEYRLVLKTGKKKPRTIFEGVRKKDVVRKRVST